MTPVPTPRGTQRERRAAPRATRCKQGLPCPVCTAGETSVRDSRYSRGDVETVRRRRECTKCGHRFTTHEVYAPKLDELVMLRKRVAAIRHAVLNEQVDNDAQ